MPFSRPIWDSSDNKYTINIKIKSDNESFIFSSGTDQVPNTNTDKFKYTILQFAEELHLQSKSWFSSQIKSNIFIKRLKNTFPNVTQSITYGSNYNIEWTPKVLYIYTNIFELVWDYDIKKVDKIHTSNNIDYSEDLNEEIKPVKTLIIQSNTAEDLELVENDEIPFDSSEQKIPISSRAIFKRKVREARLKAAIAKMNAERMAEKYFRRYGIHTDLSYESDLSFDSYEDEEEEEEEEGEEE